MRWNWWKKKKVAVIPLYSHFHYLRAASDFVIEGLRDRQLVYAEDQPEYLPLVVLRSDDERGKVLSRWPLTSAQRAAIAAGADLYLELLTYNQLLQPIVMFIADQVNVDYIKNDYFLKDELTASKEAS